MNLVSNMYYYIRGAGKNVIPLERSVIGFYHLCIVLKGSFTYTINGKEVSVCEGDALLLPSGTIRERAAQKEFNEHIVFNFKLKKESEFPTHILFKNAVDSYIRNLLDSHPCKYYNDLSHNYNFYIKKSLIIDNSRELTKTKAILHNHLNAILITLFDSLNPQSQNKYVNIILKYINDNITSPLSLTDVCQAVHLSKEYVARVFKKEMGITVTDYIIRQKLDLAKNMLSSDEMSLRNISEKLGYQDYNYFSRLFKRHYGISPMKMKKDLQNL
jgi:AraC-like DNA-binding protein